MSHAVHLVFEQNGKLWTVDNRRLVAFKAAGLERIPVVRVNPNSPQMARKIAERMNPIDGQGWQIVVSPGGIAKKETKDVIQLLRQLGKIR